MSYIDSEDNNKGSVQKGDVKKVFTSSKQVQYAFFGSFYMYTKKVFTSNKNDSISSRG